MLDKGVPSTFANLKHLYSDESKKEALESLGLAYVEKCENTPEPKEDGKGDKTRGKAAGLYFLAQHYNYHMSRDLRKSMEYVEKAIAVVPTSTEFNMTKARIYKHQGDLQKAFEAMDYARTLDVKDRYINTKAAKYQLRNNENEKAVKTMGMFTRADTPGGPFADLLDMQCVWFLTEDGESQVRQGNTALALKRFHQLLHIFDVWQEDQFDFHSFSLRKGQVRAYVDMVRWQDGLREHPIFSRAALDAVQVYLGMSQKPAQSGVNGDADETPEDATERKKAAKKLRKEQQRLEREEAERASKQDPNKAKAEDSHKKKDEDPFGLKLSATTDPLGDAMKFLEPMLQCCPKLVECQIAGFDVFIGRSKF